MIHATLNHFALDPLVSIRLQAARHSPMVCVSLCISVYTYRDTYNSVYMSVRVYI